MIVKCPKCKTKYSRDAECVEKCGVCLNEGQLKEVIITKKKNVTRKIRKTR